MKRSRNSTESSSEAKLGESTGLAPRTGAGAGICRMFFPWVRDAIAQFRLRLRPALGEGVHLHDFRSNVPRHARANRLSVG
jgi:hypothetical protein